MPEQIAKCGIVMPISAIDNCGADHWAEVRDIVEDVIADAGFEPNLVSDAEDVGIIQKRIIQNLYENPIVVCDVSGKNPNVMFELGLRLAFDKPTIIIKDEKTSYSFDTAPIEHIEYPRDLRFSRIVEFKSVLSDKIKATHKAASEDANYTTFLKNFGEFKVAKLERKEVSGQELILEELTNLRQAIQKLEHPDARDNMLRIRRDNEFEFCMGGRSEAQVVQAVRVAMESEHVRDVRVDERRGHKHIVLRFVPGAFVNEEEWASRLGARRKGAAPRLGAKPGQSALSLVRSPQRPGGKKNGEKENG